MKPTMAGSTGILKPIQAATATSQGSVTTVGDVPAAQFDWDSSGLVNPLHGEL